MKREIFIIGIGGEGALTIGEILLIAANKKQYAVSFYPFYGSQMRGGESGCIIKIDSESDEVLNPTINRPDDVLVLNDKFLDKYEKFISDDAKIYKSQSSNDKNKNLRLLKKYIVDSKLFDEETIIDSIKVKFKIEEKYNQKIEIYNEGE
ncbi:MAG: 2-oxoacid:acceptor oxidoreductase family protein [Lachnospiraceae bacterium]|nr:2-oxoacid:acceptor oxidoreductase family protein [Lachnospiraceae bacterium]